MARIKVVKAAEPGRAAAEHIGRLLTAALRDRGRASVAFSGGSTPLTMLDALAAADLDWGRIDVLQVDERVAPEDHRDRNATSLRSRLVQPTRMPAGNVHLMPVADQTPERAAAAYAATLRTVLGPVSVAGAQPPAADEAHTLGVVVDVVHLGLGADGHTASLVPGDGVLDVIDTDVAATGPYQGRRRVTMTYPLLNRAAHRVWLAPGGDKAQVRRRLLEGDATIPAGRVTPADSIMFTD